MNSVDAVEITSDFLMQDVDCNFKVTAGPGAGKTYWLVQHIKNVLKNSQRLHSAAKIACITYTNVAVEEIQKRLGSDCDRVEVSTIHSFLYANVVKPYIHLLTDDNGNCIVNYQQIDGHVEHVPSVGRVMQNRELCRVVKQNPALEGSLRGVLATLEWFFEGDKLVLEPRKDWARNICKNLPIEDFFIKYKKMFWFEGIIHHGDVLYFSYNILKKHPVIGNFIVVKYPYIFLDEFQDTNPIQTQIIKWLGKQGSIVGVIGDPAQSIYKFQGASRNDFIDFHLDGQKEYLIRYNRRSTGNIINLLNYIRGDEDIAQFCFRKERGNPVYLMEYESFKEVEPLFHELRKALSLNGDYCILTRNNNGVASLKSQKEFSKNTAWENLYDADFYRAKLLEHILSAQEIAMEARYETALLEIAMVFRTDKDGNLKEPFRDSKITDKMLKRGYEVSFLEYLINNRVVNLEKTVLDFYNDLNDEFFAQYDLKLSKASLNSGKFTKETKTLKVQELVDGLKLKEEKNATIRTIHKAKGAEFQSVLVVLENYDQLQYLLEPNINDEEDETRINYVACSRAEDLLCIAVPKLEEQQRERIRTLFSGQTNWIRNR